MSSPFLRQSSPPRLVLSPSLKLPETYSPPPTPRTPYTRPLNIMDRANDETPSAPVDCAKGCGFFGHPGTLGMCSACFRDHAKTAQAKGAQGPPSPPPLVLTEAPAPVVAPSVAASAAPVSPLPPPSAPASPSPPTRAVAASPPPVVNAAPSREECDEVSFEIAVGGGSDDGEPRAVQKNTSRCFSCRKKIGLTGFQCRCDYFFCSEHRYSDRHGCDFDYRAQGRAAIADANPVVVAAKVEMI